MKLISFDIGIKNMAYCVFTIENQKIRISDWGIINMLMEENTLANVCPPCNIMIPGKTKKQAPRACGKKSIFTSPTCDFYFCTLHSKKSADFIFPQKEFSRSFIKKLKMDNLQKKYSELFQKKENREDLGKKGEDLGEDLGDSQDSSNPSNSSPKMKKQEYIDAISNYYETKCFRKIESPKPVKRANDMDLITIGRIMKRKLDEIPSMKGATHIIMENQISPLASRMKTVQGMLTQYFIHLCDDSTAIEYVSSANKLKGFQLDETAENSYKQHKKDSIVICEKFLRMNFLEEGGEDWGEKMAKSSKKDDLADSFLQGIWYLKHCEMIQYTDDLRIKVGGVL